MDLRGNSEILESRGRSFQTLDDRGEVVKTCRYSEVSVNSAYMSWRGEPTLRRKIGCHFGCGSREGTSETISFRAPASFSFLFCFFRFTHDNLSISQSHLRAVG